MPISLMRAQRNLLADILAGSPVKVDALTHADGAKSLAASLSYLTRKAQIEDVTPADADVRVFQITADGKASVKRHDDIMEEIFALAEADGVPVTRDEPTMKDIADHVSDKAQGVKRLTKLAVAGGWVNPKAQKTETEAEAETPVAAGVSADEPSEVTDEPKAGKKRRSA